MEIRREEEGGGVQELSQLDSDWMGSISDVSVAAKKRKKRLEKGNGAGRCPRPVTSDPAWNILFTLRSNTKSPPLTSAGENSCSTA